ncbi:hypothetical protein, partial [Emergencia timonensis]|uniref:hypothetical protein n=1 Tax=Emergencia timonensis TaxID=1776384 RepID=UPI001D0749A2
KRRALLIFLFLVRSKGFCECCAFTVLRLLVQSACTAAYLPVRRTGSSDGSALSGSNPLINKPYIKK